MEDHYGKTAITLSIDKELKFREALSQFKLSIVAKLKAVRNCNKGGTDKIPAQRKNADDKTHWTVQANVMKSIPIELNVGNARGAADDGVSDLASNGCNHGIQGESSPTSRNDGELRSLVTETSTCESSIEEGITDERYVNRLILADDIDGASGPSSIGQNHRIEAACSPNAQNGFEMRH